MMKKFVLLACLLPCMSFAQSVSSPSARLAKLFRQTSESSVQLRAGTALLDSVYMFQGKENTLSEITSYTYDGEGAKKESIRKVGRGIEDVNDFRVTSKTEYKTYPDAATNSTVDEEVIYIDEDGKWVPSYKSLTWKNSVGAFIRQETYMYRNNEWVKDFFDVATEIKDGLPVVMMDSTWEGQAEAFVMKMELSYEKGQVYPSLNVTSHWDKETKEWVLSDRSHLTWDNKGNILRQYTEEYEDGEWIFSFDYVYTFDERGNMIYSNEKEDGYGTVFYTRYQNFYSDQVVTHNEKMVAEVSPLQINFASSSKVLSIDLKETDHAVLTIVSASGAVVRQQTLTQLQNRIPVNNLPKGFYIINVKTTNESVSKTVIFN